MTKLNIAQRISAAMNDVDYIQKEKKQGMQYTIVSHDAMTLKPCARFIVALKL